MDNQNKNNHEEMPQAQSMQKVRKKDIILVCGGLASILIGNLFLRARMNMPASIFVYGGLALECIAWYKLLKYRRLTKFSGFNGKKDK